MKKRMSHTAKRLLAILLIACCFGQILNISNLVTFAASGTVSVTRMPSCTIDTRLLFSATWESRDNNDIGNRCSVVADGDTVRISAAASEETTTVTLMINASAEEVARGLKIKYAINGVEQPEFSFASGTLSISLTATTDPECDDDDNIVAYNFETKTVRIISLSYAETKTAYLRPTAYEGCIAELCFLKNGEKTGRTVNSFDEPIDLGTLSGSYLQGNCVASNGYQFYGWSFANESGSVMKICYANEDGVIQDVPTVEGNVFITPVFKPNDSSDMYRMDGNTYFFFDEVINVAKSSTAAKEIVVINSGALLLSGGDSITIPSNVTLVLPHDGGNGNYSSYPANYNYAVVGSLTNTCASSVSDSMKVKNRKIYVTVSEKLTINCEGIIKIGGTIGNASGGQAVLSGGTGGDFAQMTLDGTLILSNQAKLSVCGYLVGNGLLEVTGKAEVYQPFVFGEYNGGGHTVAVAGYSAGKVNGSYQGINPPISPFYRYCFINIQTKTKFYKGALLYCYVTMYANDAHNTICAKIIGDGNGQALLQLTGADAYLSTWYDSNDTVKITTTSEAGTLDDEVGNLHISIHGDAKFDHMNLQVELILIGSVTMNSSKVVFPVPYNFSLEIDSGNFTVENSVQFLPGSSLWVKSGATLTVKDKDSNEETCSLVFFEQLDPYSNYGTSNVAVTAGVLNPYKATTYPTQADLQSKGKNGMANLIVDGKLQIDGGFGGIVQSNGCGQISIASNATVSSNARFASVGIYEAKFIIFKLKTYYEAGRVDYTSVAKARIGDEIKSLETGKTYYSYHESKQETISGNYKLYTSSSNTNTTQSCAYSVTPIIEGTWSTTQTAAGANICRDVFYKQNGDKETTSGTTFTYDGAEPAFTSYPEEYTSNDGFVYRATGDWEEVWTKEGSNSVVTRTMQYEPIGLVTYTNGVDQTKGINLNYRLHDYIWLNASFYLDPTMESYIKNGSTFDPSVFSAVSKGEDMGKDLQIVAVAEGDRTKLFILRKVYADELVDDMVIKLRYKKDNIDIIFPVEINFSQMTEERYTGSDLFKAMKLYGAAADNYFNKDSNTLNYSEVESISDYNKAAAIAEITGRTYDLQNKGDGTRVNGNLCVKTSGANFSFDERISMQLTFRLSGIDTSNVQKVGILVGKPTYEALDFENSMSYVIYQRSTPVSSDSDNKPDPNEVEIDVPQDSTGAVDLNGAMTACFDLKGTEYGEEFQIRPYVVMNDGTTVYYGHNFIYSLKAYICRTYNTGNNTQNWNEFLVSLWYLADIAKG